MNSRFARRVPSGPFAWRVTRVLVAVLAVTAVVGLSAPVASAKAVHRPDPCASAFPNANSTSNGGLTLYNRQSSVKQVVCDGWGRKSKFDLTAGVKCALISTAIGAKAPHLSIFVDGVCSGASLAADHSRQAQLTAACDFLSEMLGVPYPVAGHLAGIACESAYPFGTTLESKHEHDIAVDVERHGKCMKYQRHVGGRVEWSAVTCSPRDKRFTTLARPVPKPPVPTPPPTTSSAPQPTPVTASPPPPSGGSPGRIEIGLGIDGIRLGDSQDRVIGTLGEPDQVTSNPNGEPVWFYNEPRLGMTFYSDAVGHIYAGSTAARTPEGIGPGATLSQVESTYPGIDCAYQGGGQSYVCLIHSTYDGLSRQTVFPFASNDPSGVLSEVAVQGGP